MAVRMSGGKMKDYMPWSGNLNQKNQGLFELTPENIAGASDEVKKKFGISLDKNPNRVVAMTGKKVLQYKKSQDIQERIVRLKGLKNKG